MKSAKKRVRGPAKISVLKKSNILKTKERFLSDVRKANHIPGSSSIPIKDVINIFCSNGMAKKDATFFSVVHHGN